MAQQLNALAAVAEKPLGFGSTHEAGHTRLSFLPIPGDLLPSCGPAGAACTWYTGTRAGRNSYTKMKSN